MNQNRNKLIFEYKKNINDGNKKKEIIRMAQENLHMLKRLTEKTSHYNFNKYEKEYDKAQYYKRSHCAFPSIDFYKTQRSSSFGGNYVYTSLNNYYPSTTSNLFNINSYKKKFEDFHYEDFADIKPVSRKENKKDKEKEKGNESKNANENNEDNKKELIENKEKKGQKEDDDKSKEKKEDNKIDDKKIEEGNNNNENRPKKEDENKQKDEDKNKEGNTE